MITLITGTPGAGKTAAAVDLIISEYSDRPLYVDGLDGLVLDHESFDATTWPDTVPDGALIVIDEVQRLWRPRAAGSKVPPSVAALETHRHHGLDFLIITQSPKLLDVNVRGLIGRHLHIRDTGTLGRWIYEWPECNIDLAFRACLNKRKFALPKHVFDKYKSASMHVKPVRKLSPMLTFAAVAVALALILIGVSVYKFRQLQDVPKVDSHADKPRETQRLISESPRLQKTFIDDRVDFIPRISGKPETAPAFDDVRKVTVMPLVAGGACFLDDCRCYTQQGTQVDMSSHDCRVWITRRPFNPYYVAAAERPAPHNPPSAE